MKRLLIVFACLMAAACTTTSTRLAAAVESPPPGTTVLLIKPDIELSLLTASGLKEPRADWTAQGTENIETQMELALSSASHTFNSVDPEDAMGGRTGQMMRLHEAVGQSILLFDYAGLKLPTKAEGFDWTIGDGAQVLREEYDADYALFVYGRGSYASAGRVATMVVASLIGASVPLGNQQVFASLVDLRTGRVVWFNVAVAGPGADMRDPEGARSLVASLLKDAPL